MVSSNISTYSVILSTKDAWQLLERYIIHANATNIKWERKIILQKTIEVHPVSFQLIKMKPWSRLLIIAAQSHLIGYSTVKNRSVSAVRFKHTMQLQNKSTKKFINIIFFFFKHQLSCYILAALFSLIYFKINKGDYHSHVTWSKPLGEIENYPIQKYNNCTKRLTRNIYIYEFQIKKEIIVRYKKKYRK